MLDAPLETGTDGDYVEFHLAGTPAAGEYRCSECSYGITLHSQLPTCPMCGSESWEQAEWSPLTRAAGRARDA